MVSESWFRSLACARHVEIRGSSDRGRLLFPGRHEVRPHFFFQWKDGSDDGRRLLAVGLETGEISIYHNLFAVPGKWEVTSSIPVGYDLLRINMSSCGTQFRLQRCPCRSHS